MTITLDVPDELAPLLASFGQDAGRAVIEAIALEQLYRERKLSTGQLRRILGYRTRIQVYAFLKEHGVYLQYGLEDLEHDRKAGDSIPKPEEGQPC
jgi:hypothetical protein